MPQRRPRRPDAFGNPVDREPRFDFLDRADSDAICLAQGAIAGQSFCDPHLGANETGGVFGRINRCLEDQTVGLGITQRVDRLDMDTTASLATRQAKQTRGGHIPGIVEELKFTSAQRKIKILR
jgi:hypothetical protein